MLPYATLPKLIMPVAYSDPFGLCPPKTLEEVLPCAGQMSSPWMNAIALAFTAETFVLPMGEGAALSKIGQAGVQANRARGLAAERAAVPYIESKIGTIIGSQVGAQTSEGLRVIDHLAQQADGGLVAVEVKSGNAVRSASQLAKDAAMETKGAVIVGKNAPVVLKGQAIRLPTIEVTVQ